MVTNDNVMAVLNDEVVVNEIRMKFRLYFRDGKVVHKVNYHETVVQDEIVGKYDFTNLNGVFEYIKDYHFALGVANGKHALQKDLQSLLGL